MSEPVAGFGHVDWLERAHHWHREHDVAAQERDALRERLALSEREHADTLRRVGEESLSLIGDLRAEVRRLRREARDANRDAIRAEVARCDEELRRLGAQWAERNEALRAEVERLRKQARCGHSPWPCNCGYSGGMCG